MTTRQRNSHFERVHRAYQKAASAYAVFQVSKIFGKEGEEKPKYEKAAKRLREAVLRARNAGLDVTAEVV